MLETLVAQVDALSNAHQNQTCQIQTLSERLNQLARENALITTELGRLAAGMSAPVAPFYDADLADGAVEPIAQTPPRLDAESSVGTTTPRTSAALTPFEQLQQIRQAVLGAPDSQAATNLVAEYFLQMRALRKHIDDIESKAWLVEPPIGSRAPIIGAFLRVVRGLWYRVGLRWYTYPMLVQQTQFNMGVSQTLRNVATDLEQAHTTLKQMESRLAQLDQHGAHLSKMPD